MHSHEYRREAVYAYCDIEGHTYARKTKSRCECGAKTFAWSQNLGRDIFVKGKPDECLPYGTELLSTNPDRVWLVEGEKDVQTLVRRGEAALSIHGWEDRWARLLREVPEVIIVADADQTGRKNAMEVRQAVVKQEIPVISVVESEYGKDVTEHFENGGALVDLIPRSTRSITSGLADTFKQAKLRSTDPVFSEYDGPKRWVNTAQSTIAADLVAGVDTVVQHGDILEPYLVRVRCGPCNAYIQPYTESRTKEGTLLKGRPCYRCRVWYDTTEEA